MPTGAKIQGYEGQVLNFTWGLLPNAAALLSILPLGQGKAWVPPSPIDSLGLQAFPREGEPLSHVRIFAAQWTVARQAPLSMKISRQESWSGLSFPAPGELPNPGMEAKSFTSPALAGGFFTSEPPGLPRRSGEGAAEGAMWQNRGIPSDVSGMVPWVWYPSKSGL